MGGKINKWGIVMIAAAILSLLLSVLFFLRPESVLASGTTNASASNLNRMTRVVDIDADSVMQFTLPCEKSEKMYGLSLYMKIFQDGNTLMHCDLPEESRLVYSVMNEKGETVTSNSVSLSEFVLDAQKVVENRLPVDARNFKNGETLQFFFALVDTPDDIVVSFYGYKYREDETRNSLTLEHGSLVDDGVLLYRVIIVGDDNTAGMIFLIMAFVFAEGAVLLMGDKHATRK